MSAVARANRGETGAVTLISSSDAVAARRERVLQVTRGRQRVDSLNDGVAIGFGSPVSSIFGRELWLSCGANT